MHMLRSKYILFTIFLLSVASVSAQKAERDYIRKGNRLFNDSVFVDAEVNYRKALEVNPKSAVSMYNLGNTLSQQQKFQEAMEQYDSASKIEKDKMKLAHIYHNMGVLFQAGKDYVASESEGVFINTVSTSGKYDVKIKKVDSDDENKTLAGVKFGIIKRELITGGNEYQQIGDEKEVVTEANGYGYIYGDNPFTVNVVEPNENIEKNIRYIDITEKETAATTQTVKDLLTERTKIQRIQDVI